MSIFKKYDIPVGGLQETKWFRNTMYRVGESVVLTSGRDVPGDGVMKQRG